MNSCSRMIRGVILVIAAVSTVSNAATINTPKTRVDIRVSRSPHPETDATTAYVLAPRYEAVTEDHSGEQAQQQSSHASAISEAQYQALLKQAQKALQGYDISKLASSYQPAEDQGQIKVHYKPEVSIKYVYTDAPTSITYNSGANSNYKSQSEHDDHEQQDYYSKHKFGYRVHDPHTGAAFGHSEVSEGHVTKGHYHVLLPDGRLQNVKYVADPSGYHATVSYEPYKSYVGAY